jgi:hypothetical protein
MLGCALFEGASTAVLTIADGAAYDVDATKGAATVTIGD